MARESFAIGAVRVRAGTTRNLELPITRLVTGADVSLPVRVVHGREDGPTMWINAAIHGDEVVGVEVVRQVLAGLDPKQVPRHAGRRADRQRARLHERRPLPARPARPQPVLPRVAARVAGQPDRAPGDDRGRRQVRGGHRPAHRRPTAAPTCPRSGPTWTTASPGTWPRPSARRSCCTRASATARCATPPGSGARRCCSTRAARPADGRLRGRRRRRWVYAGCWRPSAWSTGPDDAPPPASAECRAQRLGAGPAHRHPPPRRGAGPGGQRRRAARRAGRTRSARRCASCTPTAPASSSAAPSSAAGQPR